MKMKIIRKERRVVWRLVWRLGSFGCAPAALLVNAKRADGNEVHSRLRCQKGVVDREVAMAVVRVATCVDRVLADPADGLRPSEPRRAMSRRVGDVVTRAAVDARVGVVQSAGGIADISQGPRGGLWSMIWRVIVLERSTFGWR